jgi:hypothetical protein
MPEYHKDNKHRKPNIDDNLKLHKLECYSAEVKFKTYRPKWDK